jgi:hypothetical protein
LTHAEVRAFNKRIGIGPQNYFFDERLRRPSRCLRQNRSCAISMSRGNPSYAKVDLPSTLAKQTGRHTIVTCSEPARPKRSSEIARQSLTRSDNTGRDASQRVFPRRVASGPGSAGRTARHSCCRQCACVKDSSYLPALRRSFTLLQRSSFGLLANAGRIGPKPVLAQNRPKSARSKKLKSLLSDGGQRDYLNPQLR